MQIVIIGCGKTGTELAIQLAELGEEVVVVERDEARLDNLKDVNLVRIHGVPIDLDVLEQADLSTADAVLCVSDNENLNTMAGQIAKTVFNVPKVIVRTFLQPNTSIYEKLGLEPICTTTLIVDTIIQNLGAYEAELRLNILGTNVDFFTEEVKPIWIGKSLTTLPEVDGSPFAIIRDGRLHLSGERLHLREGDHLLLAKVGD